MLLGKTVMNARNGYVMRTNISQRNERADTAGFTIILPQIGSGHEGIL